MGTILMKAELQDVSVDNIKQYCFDHLNGREVEFFATRPQLREALVKADISPSLQHSLNSYKTLTRDECISILENSSQIWNSIVTDYQYDLDLLYKVANKINLSYVDCQESLDVAFVKQYADSMDISDFVSHRINNGTIEQFFEVPQVMNRYMRTAVHWSISRPELVSFIARYKTDVQRTEIEKFVDELYNKPVSEETLTAAYSDHRRASHSVDTVVSYFKRNRTKDEYATWDDYVLDCQRTGDDGLADCWFRDFFRPEICEYAGIQI